MSIIFLIMSLISSCDKLKILSFNIERLKIYETDPILKLEEYPGLRLHESIEDGLSMNHFLLVGPEQPKVTNYSFVFSRCPLTGRDLSEGRVGISIGESKNKFKVLTFDWCVSFHNEEEAIGYFELLVSIFEQGGNKASISFEEGANGNEVKFAEFYLGSFCGNFAFALDSKVNQFQVFLFKE